MRYLVLSLFLQFFVIAPAIQGHAGVAEASTTSEHHYGTQYDMAGLSQEERDWFLTFIKGNILAEGWGRITANILHHTSQEEQELRRQELNRLGTKIGREWCRDNDVRRIDTSMLSAWGDKLKKAAKNEPQQLPSVIRTIDCEVDSLLD